MAAETIPDIDSTINHFEGQFNTDPQSLTMLDILGVELPQRLDTADDIPEKVTMTGYTDYTTSSGDDY